MLTHPADSSRSKSSIPATRRPNRLAFSAYVPSREEPVMMSSPKKDDLKWLTMISQNRRPTVRTGFQQAVAQAKDLAWASWGSLSWASSCLSCSTPSLAGQVCHLSKTQVLLHQRSKRCQPNKRHHSPTIAVGRGAIFARLGVSAAPIPALSTTLPHHSELGGHASVTEVRPC